MVHARFDVKWDGKLPHRTLGELGQESFRNRGGELREPQRVARLECESAAVTGARLGTTRLVHAESEMLTPWQASW